MRFRYRASRKLDDDDDGTDQGGSIQPQNQQKLSNSQLRHSLFCRGKSCLFCMPSSKRNSRKYIGRDQSDVLYENIPYRPKSSAADLIPPTPSSRTATSTPYTSPSSTASPPSFSSQEAKPISLVDSSAKGRNIESRFVAVSASPETESIHSRSDPSRDNNSDKVTLPPNVPGSNLHDPVTVTPVSHSPESMNYSFDNHNSTSSSDIASSSGDRSFRSLLNYVMEGSSSEDEEDSEDGSSRESSSSSGLATTTGGSNLDDRSQQPLRDKARATKRPLQLPSLLPPYEMDEEAPSGSFRSAKEYLMDRSAAERDSASAVCSGDVPLWYQPDNFFEDDTTQATVVPPLVSFPMMSADSHIQTITPADLWSSNVSPEEKREPLDHIPHDAQSDGRRECPKFPQQLRGGIDHRSISQSRFSPLSFLSMDSAIIPPTSSSSSSQKNSSDSHASSSSSASDHHSHLQQHQAGSLITGIVSYQNEPGAPGIMRAAASSHREALVPHYYTIVNVRAHPTHPTMAVYVERNHLSTTRRRPRWEVAGTRRRRQHLGILCLALFLMVLNWDGRHIDWRFSKRPPMSKRDNSSKSLPPSSRRSGIDEDLEDGKNNVVGTRESSSPAINAFEVRHASNIQVASSSGGGGGPRNQKTTFLTRADGEVTTATSMVRNCPCCHDDTPKEHRTEKSRQSLVLKNSDGDLLPAQTPSPQVSSSSSSSAAAAATTTSTKLQHRYQWWWLTPSAQWERVNKHKEEKCYAGRNRRQLLPKHLRLFHPLIRFLTRWRSVFRCLSRCISATSSSA